MSFLYVNSVFSQRWYGINVKDYSISAQRWYRIELKVLIIDFSDKEFYVVLEGRKTMNWVLVTQKETKSLHMRKRILCKDWLEKKSTYGYWSKEKKNEQ